MRATAWARGLRDAHATFCHAAYAKAYLGDYRLTTLAMAHFLLVGERRGNLPNPFYDPRALTASGTSYLEYHRDPSQWAKATSRLFEPDQGPGQTAIRSPLSRFWIEGFDEGVQSAPGVDTGFLARCVAWGSPDPRYALARILMEGGDPPTSGSQLEARQRAYRASRTFAIERAGEKRNRNLLMVQSDGGHDRALSARPRRYDILVNMYGDGPSDPDADVVIRQTGTKTTAVVALLRNAPWTLAAYERVMMMDDDVEIAPRAIATAFDLAEEGDFDLAQPCLSDDSGTAFDALRRHAVGSGSRAATAIEIMAPIITRRALLDVGWAFEEGVSGWMVDILASHATLRRGRRIGVLGGVAMRHAGTPDLEGGPLYRHLATHGIDPRAEAGWIIEKHALPKDARRPALLESGLR